MVINLKYIYTNNYSNNLENIIKKVKSCSNVYGLFINVRDLEVNYNGEFIDLEDYLEKLEDVSKNIILNIIPISNDSSDIVSIKRENKSYINNIQDITSKFPSLKFLYTSTNIRIIEECQENIPLYIKYLSLLLLHLQIKILFLVQLLYPLKLQTFYLHMPHLS